MKNYVDLKQYIHLDNPYNLQKLCETLHPFQPMPNLQQRNPILWGAKQEPTWRLQEKKCKQFQPGTEIKIQHTG